MLMKGGFYSQSCVRCQLKCDGTRAETRLRLTTKRTGPFKSAGGRQSSRLLTAEVCGISGSNAGYTMFRGTHSIRQFTLHCPTRASPCAITFQVESTVIFR